MIESEVLVGNLVAMLKLIPALVAELGSASNILAYKDSYPQSNSLPEALHTMPAPGVLVVWQGVVPAQLGAERWGHQISLMVRGANYSKIFRQVTEGVPTGYSLPLMQIEIHEACESMNMVLPTIERQTDVEGYDYFQINCTFIEKHSNWV